MNTPSVHLSNASLAYQKQCVFSDINFTLPAGKWTGLLGPSGIGKSSLLRMIAGLTTKEEHCEGNIIASNHLPLQQQIAYMGQSDLLLPWLNTLDNTCLHLKLQKFSRERKMQEREKAILLLEKIGLKTALHQYPSQLSGGMRQRVALVRTLMQDKPIVLMDEPFSALDTMTRYQLHQLAAELLAKKTVLFITHDPMEALQLSHHIYFMQGQPASLKLIAELDSATPRAPDDPHLLASHTSLYQLFRNTEE